MTLVEALQRLTRDRADAEAAQVLVDTLDRIGRHPSVVAEFREESVQDVLALTFELIDDGRFRPDSDRRIRKPSAYLRTSVRNRSIDSLRRTRRERASSDGRPAVAHTSPPPPRVELGLIEPLYRKAVSRREPRYRPHLEQAWRQILAVLGDKSLPEVLAAELGRVPSSAELNRAYKAHERLRDAMLKVVQYREELGSLGEEDADVLRSELRLLIRCQGRGAGPSSDSGSAS